MRIKVTVYFDADKEHDEIYDELAAVGGYDVSIEDDEGDEIDQPERRPKPRRDG